MPAKTQVDVKQPEQNSSHQCTEHPHSRVDPKSEAPLGESDEAAGKCSSQRPDNQPDDNFANGNGHNLLLENVFTYRAVAEQDSLFRKSLCTLFTHSRFQSGEPLFGANEEQAVGVNRDRVPRLARKHQSPHEREHEDSHSKSKRDYTHPPLFELC